MGVESVSVAEALSYDDTLEFSCHSPTRVLLPALESMENKIHTSYRSYSTNGYIQNRWSTALKLLGKTSRTQIILSPKTPWTINNYTYLEDNTAYGAEHWWYNGIYLYLGLGYTTRCQNIRETSKVLKLKHSNLSSRNFWSSFLMSQKCLTMSPHQEATASSTSSLIWGLNEFTKVVDSPTRPRSSISCFETTPSIQLSISSTKYYTHPKAGGTLR